MSIKPIYLIESTYLKAPQAHPKIMEAVESGEYPPVIYPIFRAITADKVTRNWTRYPEASLIGSESDRTGLSSFTYPYPIPILRDHLINPNPKEGRPAQIPYGRVAKLAEFIRNKNGGYVQIVAAITDPDAIRMTLNGQFLTTSLGSSATEVTCSICGENLADEDNSCDHIKGELYKSGRCIWDVGPIRAREHSYVNAPSDDESGIIGFQEGIDLNERDGDVKPWRADQADPEITKPLGPPWWSKKRPGQYNPLDPSGNAESYDVQDLRVLVLNENYEFVNAKTARRIAEIMPRRKVFSFVESLQTMKSDKTTDNLDSQALTEGELYALVEGDENYNTPDTAEAVLTTKARKALPDSAFCYVKGDVRKFPANDASHCRNGLARLSRSSLTDAEKAKVRACLVRKAKKFGVKVSKEAENITLLAAVHPKTHWKHDLYTFTPTAEGIRKAYTEITSDERWPSEVIASMQARLLAASIEEAGDETKGRLLFESTLPQDLMPSIEPVIIEVDDENYPILFDFVCNTEYDVQTNPEATSTIPDEFNESEDLRAIYKAVYKAIVDEYKDNPDYDWPEIAAIDTSTVVAKLGWHFYQHDYTIEPDGSATLSEGVEGTMVFKAKGTASASTTAEAEDQDTAKADTNDTPDTPDTGETKTEPATDTASVEPATADGEPEAGKEPDAEPEGKEPAEGTDTPTESEDLKKELHRRSAHTLALLKKATGRIQESVEDLTTKYLERSEESLLDSIADLTEEIDTGKVSGTKGTKSPTEVVDFSTVVPVHNPVGDSGNEQHVVADIEGAKNTSPEAGTMYNKIEELDTQTVHLTFTPLQPVREEQDEAKKLVGLFKRSKPKG